ncbi:MAG: molybdenum cofactor guanylyltransferase [Thermoplasmata archaeon]
MVLVSGLILAGGSGRRLEAFKPELTVGGRPLILRVIAAIRPLAQEIVVVHGPQDHREKLEGMLRDVRFVGDEGEGPLAGLSRGAHAARGDWVLVAPADAPFLSSELYGRLLEEAQASEGCIPPFGARENALIAAYRRRALLRASEALLGQGEKAAHSILPRLRLDRLAETDLATMPFGTQCTFDIDTREDLARAEEILAARGDVKA